MLEESCCGPPNDLVIRSLKLASSVSPFEDTRAWKGYMEGSLWFGLLLTTYYLRRVTCYLVRDIYELLPATWYLHVTSAPSPICLQESLLQEFVYILNYYDCITPNYYYFHTQYNDEK